MFLTSPYLNWVIYQLLQEHVMKRVCGKNTVLHTSSCLKLKLLKQQRPGKQAEYVFYQSEHHGFRIAILTHHGYWMPR